MWWTFANKIDFISHFDFRFTLHYRYCLFFWWKLYRSNYFCLFFLFYIIFFACLVLCSYLLYYPSLTLTLLLPFGKEKKLPSLHYLCCLKMHIFYGWYIICPPFSPIQRFLALPNIFVTARHQVLKRPQDALALWVVDLRKDSFKLCARETKIFDGVHKDIKVVSDIPLTWFLQLHLVLLSVVSLNEMEQIWYIMKCWQFHKQPFRLQQ